MTKTFALLKPIDPKYVELYHYCKSKKFVLNKDSIYAVAKRNSVSKTTLHTYLAKGLVKSPSGLYFTEDVFNHWCPIIEDIKSQKYGIKDLSNIYKTHTRTIKNNLTYFNLDETILIDFRYSVDFNREKFLEDTAEKWYWIGFILADGYVKKNELVLKLSKKDESHLHKFCKFMELDPSHIKYETNDHSSYTSGAVTTAKVVLNDAAMLEYLRTLNILTAKSCCEKPPSYIPNNFKRDFIRGIFDGDGSIRTNLHGITVVGGIDILKWIVNEAVIALPELRKAAVIRSSKTKLSELYYIGWYKLEDKKLFLNWIYKGSKVYLGRKYTLYKEIWRL